MTLGIWVLGDQLWQGQSALASCEADRKKVPVILIESLNHVKERRYHKQKLILVWSAMRHFAQELKTQGWQVTYKTADSFEEPLKQWIADHSIDELRVMEPADRPFAGLLDKLKLSCELVQTPNNHFLWSTDEFEKWASSRKSLLMESFYREGRKRFNILMKDKKKPVGDQWNFDKENRKPPKGKISPPAPLEFEWDEITQDVVEIVEAADFETFGESEGFGWAVTREQALRVLDYFVCDRLTTFGPYQDAMVTGEDTMWHALLSPYLNIGLLQPMEVIEAVADAYEAEQSTKQETEKKAEEQSEKAPLNSVEGFIRQVLGWREYMRGIYNHVDDDYPSRNHFEHNHALPEFFWDGDTQMNCLHQTIDTVKRTGYAHHIQRLMILSNFSLISGLSPQAVEDWFHAVFIDAYDWVMQTNVIGMGLFADGGLLATKPYASSANYVNKMSDYCKGCKYDKKARVGEEACPFNFFYWDFLDRHREELSSQGRMSFILRNLDKMSEDELDEIREKAKTWHESM